MTKINPTLDKAIDLSLKDDIMAFKTLYDRACETEDWRAANNIAHLRNAVWTALEDWAKQYPRPSPGDLDHLGMLRISRRLSVWRERLGVYD